MFLLWESINFSQRILGITYSEGLQIFLLGTTINNGGCNTSIEYLPWEHQNQTLCWTPFSFEILSRQLIYMVTFRSPWPQGVLQLTAMTVFTWPWISEALQISKRRNSFFMASFILFSHANASFPDWPLIFPPSLLLQESVKRNAG